MIRRFVNSMRLILPRAWVVLLAIACYAAFEGTYWYVVARGAGIGPPEATLRPRDIFAACGMFAFGAFRVREFHPVFLSDYAQWLARTPWNYRKPLPNGPVNIVWQDVLVFAVVMLALHDPQLNLAYVVIAYLLGYFLYCAMRCS